MTKTKKVMSSSLIGVDVRNYEEDYCICGFELNQCKCTSDMPYEVFEAQLKKLSREAEVGGLLV